MKIYYGNNAIHEWLSDDISRRSYRSKPKGRRSKLTTAQILPNSHTKRKTTYQRSQTDIALEYLHDIPDIPLPLRKLTPAGKIWEASKLLAHALIVIDPLDLIDDD